MTERNKKGFQKKNKSWMERKQKSATDCAPEPKTLRSDTVKESQYDRKKGCTNRIVHFEKNKTMWNSAIHKHLKTVKKSVCALPQFDIEENFYGTAVEQTLICFNCSFKHIPFKLFDLIDNGNPKPQNRPAETNRNLAAAMLNSETGAKGITSILHELDVPAISRQRLQSLATDIGPNLTKAAEDDQLEKAELAAGTSKIIESASLDTTYDTHGPQASRKTGQQLSTQAITTVVTQLPNNKKSVIIAADLANRRCYKGKRSKNTNKSLTCGKHPDAHPGCTQTQDRNSGFSEMAGARNCGVKLKKAGFKVKIAVTDGDSSLHKGFQEGLQCEVEAQRCTTHLSEGQYKKAHKANFSDTMFATVGEKKTTQQKIKERKRILARDIKNRSGLVRKNLIKKCKGNISTIKDSLPHIINCITECYAGEHKNCEDYSADTCKFSKDEDIRSWFTESNNLNLIQPPIHRFDMTEKDKAIMKELLQEVLGYEKLQKQRHLRSTNINESINRGIHTKIPRHKKLPSTANARLASYVIEYNNGPYDAMIKRRQCLGLPTSPAQDLIARKKRKVYNYQKQYYLNPKNVAARRLRDHQASLSKFCGDLLDHQGDYKKGGEDETQASGSTSCRSQRLSTKDHSYLASYSKVGIHSIFAFLQWKSDLKRKGGGGGMKYT